MPHWESYFNVYILVSSSIKYMPHRIVVGIMVILNCSNYHSFLHILTIQGKEDDNDDDDGWGGEDDREQEEKRKRRKRRNKRMYLILRLPVTNILSSLPLYVPLGLGQKPIKHNPWPWRLQSLLRRVYNGKLCHVII